MTNLEELGKKLQQIASLAQTLTNAIEDLQQDIRGMKLSKGYCNQCNVDHREDAISLLRKIELTYAELKEEMEKEKP